MSTRLGHYDIVEELGRGGMGVVYKGYEAALGRFVAIKVLSSAMAHDQVFVERFMREARAMATLNDSHIIQIYFIGQDEEQTFFVMEFVDGEPLSNCMKREGRLIPSDALKILLHASQGLAAAHAQGVIHRDIKPGNIMIGTRGQVKLTDFGIALANHDVSSKLTATGGFIGTPGYVSPEVCLGRAVDQRSDIFALGIVLFEMLAGNTPFNAESPLQQMLDVVETPTPDIRAINPEVDAEVARILGKLLAKSPDDRYQDCEQLNADLKRHPLVMNDQHLQLVPMTGGAANAARPTVVGSSSTLPPGDGARVTGAPPVLSRTPLQVPSLPGTASTAITRVVRHRRGLNTVVLLGSAAVLVALLGWLLGRAGSPPVAPPAAAVQASAPAAAVSVPGVLPSRNEPGLGHGGEHTARNRVRAIAGSGADAEPAPGAAKPGARGSAKRTAGVAPAEKPSTLTKARRGFLCRVFRKCDPPQSKRARK